MSTKTILVCPLDWGLGHATRCVPLIKQFIDEGHNVIIGADNNPLAFLQQEFPQLATVIIPGYEVEYDEKGSVLKLFYESVKFYNYIKKEKQLIDEIIEQYQIDRIVSDNRYGLYSDKVESIIITHQLYPKSPLAVGEKMSHKQIEKLLLNFDEVWIPDVIGVNNLSGDLSHLNPLKQQHKFIGVLSRFKQPIEQPEIEYDICAIISGPEPQRSIFEELIIHQIKANNLKAIVCRGQPSKNAHNEDFIYNHLTTKELKKYILKSNYVVCRSGYSSIMDLFVLEKKALLVPTPGQTEQEYLAEYHKDRGQFLIQQQDQLNLRALFHIE